MVGQELDNNLGFMFSKNKPTWRTMSVIRLIKSSSYLRVDCNLDCINIPNWCVNICRLACQLAAVWMVGKRGGYAIHCPVKVP